MGLLSPLPYRQFLPSRRFSRKEKGQRGLATTMPMFAASCGDFGLPALDIGTGSHYWLSAASIRSRVVRLTTVRSLKYFDSVGEETH